MCIVDCVFVATSESPRQVAEWLVEVAGCELLFPEEVLHRETGLIFDKLIASRPELPMLLVHDLDTLVAAHLPGSGTYTFDPLMSPDLPDIEVWRPWVVS